MAAVWWKAEAEPNLVPNGGPEEGELTVRLSVSEHLRRFVWMMWLGLISRYDRMQRRP